MVNIIQIHDDKEKSNITRRILENLPEWFGDKESLEKYVNTVKGKPFYAAVEENKNSIGFLSLKLHNKYTADLYVTGILKKYHRQGIGKLLVQRAESYLMKNKYKFFMVKTLGESSSDESYAKTRKFYFSQGFYPMEEIKEIWGEKNPCLIMVKNIENDY
ncbi:GNAT family N-acetyltransferase [Spirochaeta isovalerica]|uniref:Ribosomal protein S18 acetylase RimI-like enzyme n=1 Tax=Spirochaeta isovalerica TaxID=150 RepID=A0A841RGZ8_9SPIO|nr:GNAT family N-acetyltransferase [Spirochaeta isovalerica]MBB6482290.1 ribosomal protein S18 acetylase RimI-like enzyme [Spirochaeta isovalerica]